MSMSPSTQIALSAIAGVAGIAVPLVIRLLRNGEGPGRTDFLVGVPAAGFFGVLVFDWIHEGGLPRTGRLIRDGAALALCVAGLIGSVRMLHANWHDEEALTDWYGSSEGYIPRPQRLPIRIKALLSILLFAGLATAIAISYFHSMFAPE
jgi:hypothetical protein